MPLNCPELRVEYGACQWCRFKHDDECWHDNQSPVKLRDILTLEERICLLEDNTTKKQIITNVSLKEYQQQAGMILYLQQKIEEHIDYTNKDSY